MTPRIRLAHHLLAACLDRAGLAGTLRVPDPEGDPPRHAWRDLGAAGVVLLAGRFGRVATVELPPGEPRPGAAVVTVHRATSPAGGPLVADVQIRPALLDRLGFEAMP